MLYHRSLSWIDPIKLHKILSGWHIKLCMDIMFIELAMLLYPWNMRQMFSSRCFFCGKNRLSLIPNVIFCQLVLVQLLPLLLGTCTPPLVPLVCWLLLLPSVSLSKLMEELFSRIRTLASCAITPDSGLWELGAWEFNIFVVSWKFPAKAGCWPISNLCMRMFTFFEFIVFV